jgi:hypothetical protein
MTWAVKPGVSLADLAAIDLRRITDVLQVDHASLFLRDPDDPGRAAVVAEMGLPVSEALSDHRMLLTRVLHTGAAEVQHPAGGDETCFAALATPLVHEGRAVGAVLLVTRRANRRLGAIDAQVVQRATKALVQRFLAARDRGMAEVGSERFVRDAPAARRW